MRLSTSVKSRYTSSDPRESARAMIARASAAREAGLDGLYVGDHHSVGAGFHQNTSILGRLAAEWSGTLGAIFVV
ncbi:MAG: hypothetical protein ABFR53_06315, partial [Actinomycetota bacterium]